MDYLAYLVILDYWISKIVWIVIFVDCNPGIVFYTKEVLSIYSESSSIDITVHINKDQQYNNTEAYMQCKNPTHLLCTVCQFNISTTTDLKPALIPTVTPQLNNEPRMLLQNKFKPFYYYYSLNKSTEPPLYKRLYRGYSQLI